MMLVTNDTYIGAARRPSLLPMSKLASVSS
jgi:hypothetical protein